MSSFCSLYSRKQSPDGSYIPCKQSLFETHLTLTLASEMEVIFEKTISKSLCSQSVWSVCLPAPAVTTQNYAVSSSGKTVLEENFLISHSRPTYRYHIARLSPIVKKLRAHFATHNFELHEENTTLVTATQKTRIFQPVRIFTLSKN